MICNCKMSKLLNSSSSNVFRPNPYSYSCRTKTYQGESTHNAKMYIISKTNYLSFTCRWGRCSGVAPVCLVSVHQTIRICSRPPPPPGLGLSISHLPLSGEMCASLTTRDKRIKVKKSYFLTSKTHDIVCNDESSYLRVIKDSSVCDTGGELLNEPFFRTIKMLNS